MTAMPSDVLRHHLINAGLGALPEAASPKQVWKIFAADMSDEPDNAVCIYDTAGVKDGRDARTRVTLFHPGFQVRTRANYVDVSYAKMTDLRRAIDAIKNATVVIPQSSESWLIEAASLTTSILDVGIDEKKRNHHTLNGTLTLRRID